MEPATVIVTREEGLALVTLNRPDALNALNRAVLGELEAVFRSLEPEPDLRVVVLTGAGKAFVAGADIKDMADFGPEEARAFARAGQAVFNRIAAFPRPVIAAVNGFALGGGCELALACDLRIASARAKAGQPEVNLGVTPGFGGTQRLARLVGPARAKRLLFTGEVIDADEALRLGLFDEVVSPEALLPRCRELAGLIAAKGPAAVAACKAAVDRGLDTTLAEGLAVEGEAFARCFATADQKEGMSAFIDKRPARFTGA